MNRELAELTVKKSADYNDKVVKALEDVGFVLVLTTETSTDSYYIVAEQEIEELDHPDMPVTEFVEDLPLINSQPKSGHWIGHREHCENLGVMPSGLGVYEWCSNCDCGIDVREWHRTDYNYCPNCGARMDEVEDGNK